jgi:hypothetical protein
MHAKKEEVKKKRTSPNASEEAHPMLEGSSNPPA